jgi:hypothetical protein
MYAFVLVKTNESHVIVYNAFHIWKPSASGSTPPGWTPLHRNCLLLRFPASNPTKELRNILAYFEPNK